MGNLRAVVCPVRRFGAEIEVNAFDGRNRPFNHEYGAMPEGICEIADVVQTACRSRVLIQKWGNNHNSESWILKPDSSCGIEICSPVLKGLNGIASVCDVVAKLSASPEVKADERCSFHVHVDVHDLSEEQVANVVCWWVKCEYALMGMVPLRRKRNRYCQMLSFTDMFADVYDPMLLPEDVISMAGSHKYFSVNTYHMSNGRRSTVEFRIMDSSACLNPEDARNYIAFLLHFVESTHSLAVLPYTGDPMTGYVWLKPSQVISMLGLGDHEELSLEMGNVREWLRRRVLENKPGFRNGVFGTILREASGDILT